MLTSDEAAEVARNAGLTIADAAALRALADDVPEAERIAAKFGAADGLAGERRFARDLFGQRPDPRPPSDGDDDPDRQFVRDLFGRTDTTDTTQE